MAEIQFGFKAIKPITALHDGQEVTYQPGDEVPAGEWKGAAVEALIENEKLMRYATNVYGAEELAELEGRVAAIEQSLAGADSSASNAVAPAPEPTAAFDGTGPFPRGPDGGFYELSDGSRVKGKAKALAAQAELDLAVEAG
jgi:hypothetical protein